LERLFIEAQFEWENIYGGKLTDGEITERRRRLQTLQLDTEEKCFPDGFEPAAKLFDLAKREADTYFRGTYNIGNTSL